MGDREKKRILPNTFIAGAPKAGTTAMAVYLAAHPEIFMAPKELTFFGKDLNFRYFSRPTWSDYLASFVRAEPESRIGDASVWYLYSTSAAAEIRSVCPDAAIIIMVRNPVDVMHALHSQMLYSADEDIEDFAVALEAEDDRKRGHRVPNRCNLVEGLFYHDVVRFSEQIERYFDTFGRDAVHVIVYDDMSVDVAAVYGSVLRFLGLNDSFRPSFDVVNANRRSRSMLYGRLVRRQPNFVRVAGRRLIPRQATRRKVGERLAALNARVESRSPMNPALRIRLEQEMAPEVQRLGNLLGRDLSHWSKSARATLE